MIHHISIPAADTRKVAEVICELFSGTIIDFRPTENAYMVWFGNEHGSAIEIYPDTIVLAPDEGEEPCHFVKAPAVPHTAVHAAISIDKTKEDIEAIGAREGWRTKEFRRGSFRVIEFWLENRLMLELLPADMAAEYLTLAAKYKA